MGARLDLAPKGGSVRPSPKRGGLGRCLHDCSFLVIFFFLLLLFFFFFFLFLSVSAHLCRRWGMCLSLLLWLVGTHPDPLYQGSWRSAVPP